MYVPYVAEVEEAPPVGRNNPELFVVQLSPVALHTSIEFPPAAH